MLNIWLDVLDSNDTEREQLIIYIEYALLTSMAFVLLFSYCILFEPNDSLEKVKSDGFKNMLNILVTSEATIFAIIISLSIFAIQLASASYSVRVIDIFLEDPYSENIFYTYVFAILYGLFIVLIVDYKLVGSYVNVLVGSTYILGIFLFFNLIFYVRHVLVLLKPNKAIDMLIGKINAESLIIRQPGSESDVVQPITDMIISALKRYDESMVRFGLEKIQTKIIDLMKNNDLNKEEYHVNGLLLYHFRLIMRQAIEKRDEYTINKSFYGLGKISEVAIEGDLNDVAKSAIEFIKEFGKIAIKERIKDAESIVASCIQIIGECSIQQRAKKVNALAKELAKIDKELDPSLKEILRSQNRFAAINNIYDDMGIERKPLTEEVRQLLEQIHVLENIANNSTRSLGDVGIFGVEHDSYGAAWYSAEALGFIGELAAEQECEKATLSAIGSLGEIGERIIQHFGEITGRQLTVETYAYLEQKGSVEGILYNITEILGKCGLTAANKKWDSPARIAAIDLCRMGNLAFKNKLDVYVITRIRESLESIKNAVSESEELRETLQVCETLTTSLDKLN